jgi:tetratricopeptide (TPR) repeat protein
VSFARIREYACLLSPFAAAALLYSTTTTGFSPDCSADDSACLTRGYEAACRIPERATPESCDIWLKNLEAHEFAEQPAWRIAAAVAYHSLAEKSSSPELAEEYRERSARLYQDVISTYPTGPAASEAYIGLSALTDDLDEYVELMRRAVAANPNSAFALEFLSHSLEQRGSESDMREAASFLEAAYADRSDPKKWYLGLRTVRLYEAVGELDRAQNFQKRMYSDSGFAEMEIEFGSLDDIERVESTLSRACNDSLVALFGMDTCLKGIESVVQGVTAEQDSERQQLLADAASSGMQRAAVAPGVAAEEHASFKATYELFISLGIHSAKVYEAWSNYLADPDQAISALEKAVKLAPDDGALVYRLGLFYLEQERWETAIDTFEKARPNLPAGFSRELLEMQLQRAEAGLESE